MHFLRYETVRASFEWRILRHVFNHFGAYVIATLKTLAMGIVYALGVTAAFIPISFVVFAVTHSLTVTLPYDHDTPHTGRDFCRRRLDVHEPHFHSQLLSSLRAAIVAFSSDIHYGTCMRYYLQHLIVLTTVSLVIIVSYIHLAFAPKNTNGTDRQQTAVTTPCTDDLLVLEVTGTAAVKNRRLRNTAVKRIQRAADDICQQAQLFAADPVSQGTALFPFRLTAYAEYHITARYRSVRVQFYAETGGAHGNVDYYTETITSRHEIVSLTDVLTEYDITPDTFVRAVPCRTHKTGRYSVHHAAYRH